MFAWLLILGVFDAYGPVEAPPPDPEPAPSVTLTFRKTPRLFGPKKIATVAP